MDYIDHINETAYAKTASEVRQQADLVERYARIELSRLMMKEKASPQAPQNAMNDFLGGVVYEDVLALVKQHYPEKFI